MQRLSSKGRAQDGRLSRREFVAALAVPIVAGACNRRPYRRSDFSLPQRSVVELLPASSYNVDFGDLIGRGLRDLGVTVQGRRVLLKPNMVEYEPGTAINTNPLVVAGAIAAFQRAGAAEVIVAEGPGHRRDTEYLLTRTGLHDHLRDHGVRFVDLNEDDVEYVPLKSNFTGLDRLALPVSVLRSDFVVSMPKLKTHHWAGMTAAMKNFFGTVPGAVYGWPKNVLHMHGIDNSILDLNATDSAATRDSRCGDSDGRRWPDHGAPAACRLHRDESGCRRRRRDVLSSDRSRPGTLAIPGRGAAFSWQYRPTSHRAARRTNRSVRCRVRRRRCLQAVSADALVTSRTSTAPWFALARRARASGHAILLSPRLLQTGSALSRLARKPRAQPRPRIAGRPGLGHLCFGWKHKTTICRPAHAVPDFRAEPAKCRVR